MSTRERKEIPPVVPKYINIFYIAFVDKYLLRGIKSRPVEFLLVRNFGLRTISVQARVFKSRRLPASGFRKKCSPLSFSLSLPRFYPRIFPDRNALAVSRSTRWEI